MALALRQIPVRANLLTELLQELDRVNHFADISKILAILARTADAAGVALYELTPDKKRIFVQAHYFQGETDPPFFHLPITSLSGWGILNDRVENHHRVSTEGPNQFNDWGKLDELNICAFCTIPILLRDLTAPDAALTFYRTTGPFLPEEAKKLQSIAGVFPNLYRLVQDKVALRLTREVQDVLRVNHFREQASEPNARATETLRHVIQLLKTNFQSLETAIYLRNPTSDAEATFKLRAGDSPWEKAIRAEYSIGQGATGWVLQHNQPVQIFDLGHYHEDKDYYTRRYPGMNWSDTVGVRQAIMKQYGLDEVWPLSYVCVPIAHEGQVLGALRCSVVSKGPFFFDDELTHTLRSLAELLADWWVHWFHDQERAAENQHSIDLLDALRRTNQEALHQMRDLSFGSEGLFSEVLAICCPLAESISFGQVWMKMPGENELKLAAFWPPSSIGPGRAVVSLGADVRDPPALLLQRAWKAKESILQTDSLALRGEALPAAGSLTVTKLATDDKTYGLLVLGSREPCSQTQSSQIKAIGEFAAQQLTVYHVLDRQFGSLRDARKQQADQFLDFQHQLRSPINMAYAHAESMLSDPSKPGDALNVIFEATRRASRVASNLKLFVLLAQGLAPLAKVRAVKASELTKRIQQGLESHYAQRALSKRLNVVPVASNKLISWVTADLDLVELALDNILDNVVKYSYNNTQVIIGEGIERNEVYFNIRHRGLFIDAAEAPKLGQQRGLRGLRAKASSPEGTGIGLWLAQQILHSMSARLVMLPTDRHGQNEVRIYFKKGTSR